MVNYKEKINSKNIGRSNIISIYNGTFDITDYLKIPICCFLKSKRAHLPRLKIFSKSSSATIKNSSGHIDGKNTLIKQQDEKADDDSFNDEYNPEQDEQSSDEIPKSAYALAEERSLKLIGFVDKDKYDGIFCSNFLVIFIEKLVLLSMIKSNDK